MSSSTRRSARRRIVPTTAILSVLQPLGLTKRDRALSIEVRRGDELLGVLELGHGSLLWKPAGAKTIYYTMRWSRFGTLMKQYGQIKSQDRA